MSEITLIATVPFNTQWEPAYEPMPVGQDQVGTIISSVSNTLDPLSFYDALKLDVAKSELKMSIGATSILPPDEEDDLWATDEAWHVTVDINDLEQMAKDLESEIGATANRRAKGVTPEKLSKIWSIDIETADRTIGLTSQHVKHGNSDHLSRRYSTNDRML